jgi:hypothetical protein
MLPFLSILAVVEAQDIVYWPVKYVVGSQLFASSVVAFIVGSSLSIPFIYQVARRFHLKNLLFRTLGTYRSFHRTVLSATVTQ